MQFGCAEAAGIRAWIAPAAAMMLSAMAPGAAAQGALPPGFVYLRDVEPTIDLTLTKVDAAPAAPFDPAATYGPCTAPAARRSPDNSVDMGTSFDCFDSASHTASSAATAEQRRWRNVLVEAMRKQGFVNYN